MTKIKENQWIILKRGDILKTVQVIKKKKHNFEKLQFTLDAIIGQEFETAWRLEKKGRNNGILMPLDFIPETESYTLKPDELDQAVRDNRSIDDKSQGNNSISDEYVLKMKKEVSEGKLSYQEMMDTIKAAAANSTTKTDYSLKKYETRKEQKHLKYFVVQKPTPRLVTKCYEGRNTGQICYLTNEAMAFMVNQLNVQKNTTIGVVETTSGMCLANILNRGANVLNFYDGSATATHCVDIMNYESEFLDESLLPFPLDKVGTLLNQKKSYEDYFRIPFDPETDKPYVLEEIGEINKVSEKGTRRGKQSTNIIKNLKIIDRLNNGPSLDGLMVVTKYHPSSVVLPMLNLVKPSRPFVVYNINREPLMECFQSLQESGMAICLEVKNTFFRQMQVLPNRTHPEMFMKGQRGYILTGIRVEQ
jgi:tRNA (adenine-N(1)-)-methyltransferase non-catalytic subunit